MQSVGTMHVFYPHFNKITGRLRLAVLPSIVDRQADWMMANTSDAFLSAVHVQSADGKEELLLTHISRILDVPVFSDHDRSNNIFYITISHNPDLYCARLTHAPHDLNTSHPCAMFLVVHALWDACMLTRDLVRHIYCVVSPTCNKAFGKWYIILITFLDDLHRTLSVSCVLLNKEAMAKHKGIVSCRVCCLEHTCYTTDDWKVDEEYKKQGKDSVHSVILSHAHTRACVEQRYVSEQAALEVATDVFNHGLSFSRHSPCSFTCLH